MVQLTNLVLLDLGWKQLASPHRSQTLQKIRLLNRVEFPLRRNSKRSLHPLSPLCICSSHLFKDIDFAISYANALCNIAEGSLALAESSRAADCLSSALQALQSHQSLDSKASPTLARSPLHCFVDSSTLLH